MTWVVNYRRKILVGLVAGVIFVAVVFLAPPVLQRVLFGLIGVVLLIELTWQAKKYAYRLSSWLLVGAMVLMVYLGLSGMLRLTEYAEGRWMMLTAACIVAVTDIAAQVIGQRYGVPGTFWPSLSPNKTIHGVVGGVVCGMVAAGATVLLGSGWFILLLPILAVAGDLLESATKRSLGIKDFANYIPQTGGLLDRVDSWLPAFALAGWVLI
jgi:phosphatidate cytidylyltransferase